MTPSHELEVLFGVTAVQLQFVAQQQVDDAVAEIESGVAGSLRERLIARQALTAAEADAVDAVVEQRLARCGNDPERTLRSWSFLGAVGASDEFPAGLAPSEPPPSEAAPGDDKHTTSAGEKYSTTLDYRYRTQAPTAWHFAASNQRFTVLRMHQQGGLGRLMIAKDEELNREIALKEILPAFADNDDHRRRFVREAEITGALEHPGVVPVYSLGEFPDGRPYYAMRLIHGHDLRTAIEDFFAGPADRPERELEFRQLLGRFVDVCHAIDYAHNRGVIHRDLKPANIMLGGYGETLVVDWGLARTIDGHASTLDIDKTPIMPSDRASTDRTQAGRVVGTLAYMSPEQAAGRQDLLAPASDIYGLGATLYHLLTGRPPFEGDTEDSIFHVQQGRFPTPRSVLRSVPRPLEAIVLKAMARQPKERYATASELAIEIERFLADEPVEAYAESLAPRTWRWIRRHRALVMSSMAAAVVAVAALSTGVALLSAANRRERDARDEADRNFHESVAQRDRAERNFQLAQDAVRDYFTRVSEETLLNQPGMQPLRDSLYRQALLYYQQFLADENDDPQLQIQVAQAQFSVGAITEVVDSPAAALPHYQQADETERALLAKPADDSTALDALQVAHAQTLNALGRVTQRLGRLDDAQDYYRQARRLREKLSAARPDDAERARALASSVMNLGWISYAKNDVPQALEFFERAQTLRLAHLDRDGPPQAKLLRDLGKGYYSIAIAQRDNADVEPNLLEAIRVFEQLELLDKNDLEVRQNLANCRRIVAGARLAAGDAAAAIPFYRQARTALRELSLRNPDVPEYAAELAAVDMDLGLAWQESGQLERALASLEAAVQRLDELASKPSAAVRYRRDWGVALRKAGQLLAELDRPDEARQRLEQSRAALAQLVREFPDDAAHASELDQTLEALRDLDKI